MKKLNIKNIAVLAVIMALISCNMPNTQEADNPDPVFYFYKIKALILDYMYLSEEQENEINELVTGGELIVIKLKLNEFINVFTGMDVSDDIPKQKIDNTIFILSEMRSVNDIETIRKSYFSRYYYTIKGSERHKMYFNKEQQRKLENLVTKGNIDDLRKGIIEITAWLEKKRKDTDDHDSTIRITYTINILEQIYAVDNIELIRQTCFTINEG